MKTQLGNEDSGELFDALAIRLAIIIAILVVLMAL